MIRYEIPRKYRNGEDSDLFKEPMVLEDGASSDSNDVFLYSEIKEETILKVIKQIDKKRIQYRKFLIENNLPISIEAHFHIHLHINSYGGSVFASFSLFDYIKRSPIPIHTHVEGVCASAASVISVAGHKRFMTKNSMIMIHQLSSWFGGKYDEFHDQKLNLDLLMDKIKRIYIASTKLKNARLNHLLKRDLFLDSDTCLEYGFVDEIV